MYFVFLAVALFVYNNCVKPIARAIRRAAMWVWRAALQPVVNAVRRAMVATSNAIANALNSVGRALFR